MTVLSAQKAVSNVQTELTDGTAPRIRETYTLRVKAPAALDLFVGATGVTSSTGYKVKADNELILNLLYGERLYGILASSTGTAYVLQQRF